MNETVIMKYISLFSGIECASVAAQPLGWEPICFSEIEPFPSAVLAHHYPDVPNVGDMTAHDWSRYRGRCDVVVGGSPCQAFSVAGRRESLADARGNLTLAFVEAVNAIDPAFVVWENVPGVLSTADNAFGCFVAGIAGHDSPLVPPRGRRWSNAGMADGARRSLAWRVLDAQFFGVPQRRRRVFLVARRAGERPHRKAGEDVAAGVGGGTEGRGEQREVTGAVSAKWEKGTGGPSGDECQNLVVGTLTSRGGDGMRIGNSFDLQGGLQVVHTLRGDGFDASEDGTGRGTPLVFDTTQVTSKDNRSNPQPGDPCHPLAAGAHSPAVTYALKTSHTESNGWGVSDDAAYTLDSSGTCGQAIAFHGAQDPDVSGDVTHPVGRNQGQETCVAFTQN